MKIQINIKNSLITFFLQTDVETQRQILSIDNTTSVNYDSELFRLFENFLETVYNEKKDKKKCGII